MASKGAIGVSVMSRYAYDVFLSHNSADKPAVEAIARRLREEGGLTPFLDKWHLIPGEPWQEALEEAIDASGSCAVFLGPAGLGSWENEEMRAALDIRVQQPEFRVIPVLLPGANLPERGRLPRFLARLTWVDFRPGLDDPDAFHRLVCGIQGIAPGPEGVAEGEAVCPFRGLEVFDEEHAPFFFGREALTQHLVEQLRSDRFLAVIGPSGSGKSSLVRAGLLPQVRGGALAGSARWPVVLFKPGPHPVEALAARLLPHLGESADPLVARQSLLDALVRDERGLHTTVQVALASHPDSQRMLLVVDQFEELFTLCRDGQARAGFIGNLLYASGIAGGQTVAVVTMRADFFGKCAAHPELAARLAERDVLVGPMSEEELRRAMEGPAEAVGLHYEKGLVETILDDLGDEPGSLPLLQHTLLELWERRRGEWLTADAYHEIGGVRGALAQRADEVYDGLTQKQQEAARRVLLRLTQPGEGTEDTRRRATLAELVPAEGEATDTEEAVKELADARLLTTGEDEAGGEVVDVAHEALIRGWPRLQGWIDEDRAALLTHRRLTEAAQEWEQNERDGSYLYRGARLAEAQEWAESHTGDLNEQERTFLETSVGAREAESRAARRRIQRVIAGLLAALAIISTLAVMALQQRDAAFELQRDILAQELIANAENQIGKDNALALLLAVEAVNVRHTFQTESMLRRTLRLPTATTALSHPGLRAVAFSHDGTRIATGGDDILARVWSWPAGEELTVLQGHTGWVVDVDITPDGERVVTASTDGTARLWDATTGDEIAVMHDPTRSCQPGDWDCRLWYARFSPDGELIVTGDYKGMVTLWDGNTGDLVQTLPAHNGGVTSVGFSPDSNLVVTTALDSQARVWDIDKGHNTWLVGHTGQVEQANFSSDSKQIVTAGLDNTAKIWDAETGDLIRTLVGHSKSVLDAGFSPDDQFIVTASTDETARIWESATGSLVTIMGGYGDAVYSADFSPQGDVVLTICADGTAHVWNPISADEQVYTGVAINTASEAAMFSAKFAPDGDQFVATGTGSKLLRWSARGEMGDTIAVLRGVYQGTSLDGKWLLTSEPNAVYVWDIATWTRGVILHGGQDLYGQVGSPSFSPDRSTILTLYGYLGALTEKGQVRLWDAATGEPIATFGTFVTDARFSPDGSLILTSGWGSNYTLWNTTTQRPIQTPQGSVIEFTSCDRILLITTDQVKEYYSWNGTELEPVPAPAGATINCSPDGKLLTEVNPTRTSVAVKDRETGKTLVTLQGRQPVFSPDSTYVATLSDGAVWVWATATGKVTAKLAPAHSVVSMEFSANAKTIIIQINSSDFQVWDVNAERLVLTTNGRPALSPDGLRVATTREESIQREAAPKVWDASTGELLSVLEGHETAADGAVFIPDGKYILTYSSGDNATRVWVVKAEDLVTLARSKTDRILTCQERQLYLHEKVDCPSDAQ
jgi:WD40 repeat protein/energy-coupling factor transporter ATP-binding protein EcfA2